MKFLLLLGALTALDIFGVIAGPVPDHDTEIVPRADQGAEDFSIDLSDIFGKKKDDSDMMETDDSMDSSCWWYWCPPDKPKKKKKKPKCYWWYYRWYCPKPKDDDDDDKTYSWYGEECPDKDDISCDKCGGETWWDGKDYATKGRYAGCECS